MPNRNEKIGALRERITIEQVTETQSSSGHPSQSWATLATVWAKVEYKITGTDEDVIAGKKTAVNTTIFTIRKENAINEKMRISYDGSYYDIEAITVTADQFYHEIQAQKRV